MNARAIWSQALILIGGVAMALGAVDPLEGALLILPGSGLVAFGALVAGADRRTLAHASVAFLLVAVGVGAMWGISALGGFGSGTGRSNWWALLLLPYPIGWSLGIWGPRAPRPLPWLGIGVGLWHVTLASQMLGRAGREGAAPLIARLASPAGVIGVFGLLTVCGCLYRLLRRRAERCA